MAGNSGTIGEVLAATTIGKVGLNEEIAGLAQQLRQLKTASQAATESAQASSRATSSAGSSGGSAGSTLLDIFGSGLGLSPLISGLASLFGGGGDNPVQSPLVHFALPPAVQVSAGVSESGGPAFAVDHPQGGLPRASQTGAPAQITVQVQAMDSRSFLDHSGEIAMAVRQAMLESSVLNDVVREA